MERQALVIRPHTDRPTSYLLIILTAWVYMLINIQIFDGPHPGDLEMEYQGALLPSLQLTRRSRLLLGFERQRWGALLSAVLFTRRIW